MTNDAADGETGSRFPLTRWSLVLRAQEGDGAAARRALDSLCRAYWHPIYCYARYWGLSPHDAEDSTQAFFEKFLSNGSFDAVAEGRGRLRSYLLRAIKNFLASRSRHESAQKRGGGQKPVSIDLDWAESHLVDHGEANGTPHDALFDRAWALSLLGGVGERLEVHYEKSGKRDVYEAIKGCLEGDGTYGAGAEISDRLGISPEALRSAVFKLRRRFKEYVEDAVRDTCADEADAREEIVHLCQILAR